MYERIKKTWGDEKSKSREDSPSPKAGKEGRNTFGYKRPRWYKNDNGELRGDSERD